MEGTYELMKSFIAIAEKDADKIKKLTTYNPERYVVGNSYPISWKVDTTQSSILSFKGYEGKMIPSEITGTNRLKYDRSKPFTKEVVYQNYFKPKEEVTIPEKYIIPQGWWNVIELLKLNKIKLKRVQKDTIISASIYKIKSYESTKSPYEGHYLHYKTQVKTSIENVKINKGDYIVNTQQKGVRYILETLEPTTPDSFFNWNFFDTILQQKEGFSPYVWEDLAWEFLENNPEIKKEFEAKKALNTDFSKNWYLQLDWIHKKSPNYEKAHLLYPIVRVGG